MVQRALEKHALADAINNANIMHAEGKICSAEKDALRKASVESHCRPAAARSLASHFSEGPAPLTAASSDPSLPLDRPDSANPVESLHQPGVAPAGPPLAALAPGILPPAAAAAEEQKAESDASRGRKPGKSGRTNLEYESLPGVCDALQPFQSPIPQHCLIVVLQYSTYR